MQERISIIIPVYNAEKYLQRCLESILAQNVEKEIICVDDGSTDASGSILRKYAEENKIVALYQNHLGAPAARNKGLEVSKGKYCLFLDADDILYQDALAEMLTLAEEKHSDIVIGDYCEIDEEDRLIKEVYSRNCFVKESDKWSYVFSPPVPGNKLYKKDFLLTNDLKFENVKIGQDLNLYLKAVAVCGNLDFLSKFVFGYRIIEGSISRTYSLKILDICNSIDDVKAFYDKLDLSKQYRQYVSFIELDAYQAQLAKMQYFQSVDRTKIKNVLCPRVSGCKIPWGKFWYRFLKKKIRIRLIVFKDYHLNNRS